jgi:hypothetical protein
VLLAPREVMPKAKEAALKAVELDDTLVQCVKQIEQYSGICERASLFPRYRSPWQSR